ncbi:Hypotetical protein [Gulosibacter molinativorax]|nr:Hypotetical protein [Gulosibacter molinativorax]
MILESRSVGWCSTAQDLVKGAPVEIRIGVENSPREISFESNQSAAEVEKIVTDSLESGVARFVDDRERVILVNSAKITFVEIGEESQRRIGFVA